MSAIDDLAADTITWSDNSSYHKLRYTCEGYEEKTLPNWLADMNISTTLATDTAFPHYAPRDSLKLWMNAYLYFQTGDEDLVTWMEDLFSSTEFSMIRDAVELEEMSGEEALEEQDVDFSTRSSLQARVWRKAGSRPSRCTTRAAGSAARRTTRSSMRASSSKATGRTSSPS